MNSTELKPCPFCGGAPVFENTDERARPRCTSCGTEGGLFFFSQEECESGIADETEAKAIAAWNRRASINSVVCEAGEEPNARSKRLHRMDELLCDYRHALLSRPMDTARAQRAYSELLYFASNLRPPGSARDSAEADKTKAPQKLWLWKNFVDGKPEYWAFDNPYPINLTDGDPQTLGEPCGYAIFKPSRQGRTDVSEEQVLRAMARAAEGAEAKSETTPEEDAALLWLGTVRDDFRRMADEANRLLSHHAMNIAASPKAGESRMEPDLREAAHTLEVAIRFAQHGLVPTAEEVTDWREVMYRLKAGERKGCHPLREASSDCTYCHGHCPSPEGCERAERLAAGVSAKDCKDCPGRESLMCCKRNAGVPIGWRRAGGGQAVKYTPETIGEAILAHVKANFGTQRAAADAFGCGHTFLNQVVHGERRPSNTMLQAIGFRHVEVWIPAGSSLPGDALPLRKDSHD